VARVGLHGLIEGQSKFIEAVPVLAWLFDVIESNLNKIDSSQLADYVAGSVSVVTTSKINDGAVTAPKLAPLSVTSAAVDSTVPKIAVNQYTGTGAVDREINLGFRARFVVIVNHTTRQLFIAWGGTGSAFARIQISNVGVIADGGTDFTGSSANGFQLGSAAGGGASNTNLVVYSYLALG